MKVKAISKKKGDNSNRTNVNCIFNWHNLNDAELIAKDLSSYILVVL